MQRYTYYATTMHLHTCHQPGSSMEAHIYNAHQLGMHYIRFTDHDTRVGAMGGRLHRFDFTFPETQTATWNPYGDAKVSCGDGALQVAVTGNAGGGVTLTQPGKAQSVSLLAEVTVTLQMEVTLTGDAGAAFAVEMSQRPGDNLPAHLYYVTGTAPADLPPHTVCVPMPAPVDGTYTFTVSADAREYAEGGMDNVYGVPTLSLWAGDGTACVRITGYEMQVAYSGEEVLRRQRVLGDAIGARYGIKPYITTEISGAGQHKNYYGEQVPCIDYRAMGKITQEEAIAHVKAHGGIVCYNHPFESGFYKKNKFTAEERPAQVQKEADTLIAARLYGATLMEVGFPRGRCGFPHADHMRLWDTLSLAGVFVTGCGDSDSHQSHLGWESGNNFASWIAAPAELPHPIADEVFIASMKAGRLYAGDPVYLRFPIDFTAEGKPMGAILPVEAEDPRPREMVFTADDLPEGWTVRLIDSGNCIKEHVIAQAGAYTFRFAVAPVHPVSFGRVELYNAEGRPVCLTNPIYLVKKDAYDGTLPAERLYEEVAP